MRNSSLKNMSSHNPLEEECDEPVPVAIAVRLKPHVGVNQSRCVVLNSSSCDLHIVGPELPQEKFRFDHILPENVSQGDVFSRVLSPFIPLFFDGFDLCVLTYGGSGCGKSFTLFGPETGPPLRSESDLGLIPRFVRHIFENYNQLEMTVKVSSFEVTNDDVCDLLSRSSGGRRKSLLVRADVDVEPATEIECSSVEEVISCYESSRDVQRLKGGFGLQHQASAFINESRENSHNFFKVILEQRVANIGKKSSVTFVDLAPSDKIIGSMLVDNGLLTLGSVVSALGDPRRNVTHIPFEQSNLTRLLRSALGGRSLTLLFCCISPLTADAEETLSTLQFGQRASNIRNNPVPNVSQVNAEFLTEEEELSYINSGGKMPMMMPDLINPDPIRLNFMLQQQFLMQQQMLSNYMMMLQQQRIPQAQKSSPSSMSSPFVPISSPAASSTLDLKSPLNVQMYLNANENNVPLSLPAQAEDQQQPLTATSESSTPSSVTTPNTSSATTNASNGGGQRNAERRSSLVAAQKHLDSILEESEHDSSTHLKSSLSSSLSSSFDDDEEEEEEEDFDSDCSDISKTPVDHEATLLSLQEMTLKCVDEEHEEMLDLILGQMSASHNSATSCCHQRDDDEVAKASRQKESSCINETLEQLQDQLTSLDTIIKRKDQVMEEAMNSSLELRKAKETFESKKFQLQEEMSIIKKQLRSAQRSLSLAEKDKRNGKSHSLRLKVEDLRSKLSGLRKKTEDMEACIKLITGPLDQKQTETASSLGGGAKTRLSYEDLRQQKAKVEAKLAYELEKKAQLEAELHQEATRITRHKHEKEQEQEVEQLHSTLEKLSLAATVGGDQLDEATVYVQRERVGELRNYKEKLHDERQWLEHCIQVKSGNNWHQCHYCHQDKDGKQPPASGGASSASFNGHDNRLVEIDVLFEAVDHLIDMKNAAITGHAYQQPHVNDSEEQVFLMDQLNALSGGEAKSLLHTFLHRTIDLRKEGRAKDRQLMKMDKQVKDVDKLNKYLRHQYALAKVEYEKRISVEKAEYARRLQSLAASATNGVNRDMEERLMKAEYERDHQRERAEKYKRYFTLHHNQIEKQQSHRKSSSSKKEAAAVATTSNDEEKIVNLKGNKLIIEPPAAAAPVVSENLVPSTKRRDHHHRHK